jgi:hypothetical protein
MANIGSEAERAIRWKQEGNETRFNGAVDRMLELIDLTAADPANRQRLRELMRVRESLIDFLLYDNSYRSTDSMWKKYFLSFACAARRGR